LAPSDIQTTKSLTNVPPEVYSVPIVKLPAVLSGYGGLVTTGIAIETNFEICIPDGHEV
jgi:hypothetical protein